MFAVVAWVACSGSPNGLRPCGEDGDCELGEVCTDNACGVGCRSARDCPTDRPLCDPNAGPDGACVVCVSPSDCGDGHDCIAGECRKTCIGDVDCPGERCDLDAMVCVDCVESSDCTLGKLCLDQHCTPGCDRDRDCPADQPSCVPGDGDHGACYQCVDNAQCGPKQRCDGHACHDVCTNTTDCAIGVCDTDAGLCVDCLDKADCPLGKLCTAKQCTAGCEEDRDCPNATPACDPEAGPHGTCFECTADADCGAAPNTCLGHVCQGDGGPMIEVPAGGFVMGSDTDSPTDNPRHAVTLSAFAIDRHEVTNARYRKCVDAGVCEAPSTTTEYADPAKAARPVVYVTWSDADKFCAWAGKRLPTEAEWERAARGTTERTYPWGAAPPTCTLTNAAVKNVFMLPCINALTDVGAYPAGASAVGAYDMAGNAREWVNDWYATYPPGSADNPHGPATGTDKVARGGSWTSQAGDLATAIRATRAPTLSDGYLGFRCVKGEGAPFPTFTVTPAIGSITTSFAVDASTSSDPVNPASALQARWDWQNDGIYDTAFTTTKTAAHVYAATGSFDIQLQIKNPQGVTRTTTRSVTVVGPGGQGSPCTATTQCQAQHVCVNTMTCAHSCIIFNPACPANTTCTITQDVTGAAVFACL